MVEEDIFKRFSSTIKYYVNGEKRFSISRKILIFIITFIILGIFPLSLFLYSNYRDYTTERKVFVKSQSEMLADYERMINIEISSIFEDLLYLKTSTFFNKYITDRSNRQELENAWILYTESKKKYDQIRFIDAEGMEDIRVNLTGKSYAEAVEKSRLQDKSNRYYFTKCKEFLEPAILVSKFDLNIENGEIQVPLKPMIRFSVPVYNNEGLFSGVLVINYLAQSFFDELRTKISTDVHKIFILNADGYILLGPNPSEEWGFMYEDRKHLTFKELYLDEWKILTDNLGIAYQSEVGLYLNRTINNKAFVVEDSRDEDIDIYPVHFMDEIIHIILLGEEDHNPFLGKNLVMHVLKMRWLLISIMLVISLLCSLYVTNLYIKRFYSERLKEQYRETMNQIVNVLEHVTAIEDDSTGHHIKRVCQYSKILCRGLGLHRNKVELISNLASLHDIGKIGVHDSILKKRGRLTEDEIVVMKQHVAIGYELASKTNLNKVATNIIKYHHERWDGKGYLYNLKKDEIPLESRIVSLADVYDALRSIRPYKEAFSHEKAKDIILKEKGLAFDPLLVDIFLKVENDFENISESFADNNEELQKLKN